MSAVADLENALQAMQSLKPPGVSGTKINSITALCMANVQSESVLIQKIFTHFKKTPGTHKLGVLYVVDSVTRQWVEQAKKAGQPVGNAAQDGTFAAGVNRVTELLPVLMTDIIQHAPEDQKEKIKKLVDIWERGSTFPAQMLASFKEKLNNASAQNEHSTTPIGSPPRDTQLTGTTQPVNPPNTSQILAALANIAKQNTAANSTPLVNPNNVSNTHNGVPQPVLASVNSAAAIPPTAQPVNVPTGGANLAALFQGASMNHNTQNASNMQQNPMGALASMFPQTQTNTAQPAPDVLQQQLILLQVLAQQGIPQDQWGPIIAALSANGASGAAAPAWNNQTPWNGRTEDPSRDRNGRHEPNVRSPPGRYRDHERSRSPTVYGRERDSPVPRRRDSPIYGEYNGDSDGRKNRSGDDWDRNGDRGGRGRGGRGRGSEYRRRSPLPTRRGRSLSPMDQRREGPAAGGPKWVDHDYTIGDDKIKVLSRTLFVGGVTCAEDDLRSLFARYGTVQTCIVNHEKRHAFIKMITRKDAIAAKEGMDAHKPADMQLRTRWGVGFGPRDCSDYQTGISVIPIDRLTDADRKWMLTAEYGGSGGKPIEGGMVVEEPDIEIGQGVSSKAISRRMATDQGGKTGPRSTREPRDGASRYRRNEREGSGHRDTNNAIGVPPPVPGFGFPPIPGFPNGIIFPPGFSFTGLASQQPPPPGQSM